MPMTGFRASRHGFKFSNNDITWTFLFWSGRAMCGGMAYSALDFYFHGLPIPGRRSPPPEDSHLHDYIYDRQVDAHLFAIPELIGYWSTVSDEETFQLGHREIMPDGTLSNFGEVKREIDRNVPVPICLMHYDNPVSTDSHWVIATGYHSVFDPSGGGARLERLFVYDNNLPDEDIVFLTPNFATGWFDHSRSSAKYHTFIPKIPYPMQDPRDHGFEFPPPRPPEPVPLYMPEPGPGRFRPGGTAVVTRRRIVRPRNGWGNGPF